MRRRRPRNIAASVRQRLLNHARERGEDFNYLLTRYANERLLYRLAESSYRDQFVLKGAVLFDLGTATAHRATRDVDLLGFGEPAVASVRAVFRDLCTMQVPPDGVRFLAGSVRAEPIRERQAESAIRVRLKADLDGARICLQIDVGLGDVVTPHVVEAELPTMLDFPGPRLQAYPRETVVAGNFEAMVRLGIANTHMKDLYGLRVMATSSAFCGNSLAAAFVGRPDLSGCPSLEEVVAMLRRFLLPPAAAATHGAEFERDWPAGGSWIAFGAGAHSAGGSGR